MDGSVFHSIGKWVFIHERNDSRSVKITKRSAVLLYQTRLFYCYKLILRGFME